jgi:hypothetical protein
MNAVGVRSVDDYHDASLDSLIGQRSSLVGGGSSHQRSGSHSYRPGSDFSNTSFIPPAPEVPRGPPISYPGSNGGNMNGPQRSFSQRAKGRPFAREAFANDDDEFDYDPRRGIPQPESYPGGPVQPVTNGRSRAAAPLQVYHSKVHPNRLDRRPCERYSPLVRFAQHQIILNVMSHLASQSIRSKKPMLHRLDRTPSKALPTHQTLTGMSGLRTGRHCRSWRSLWGISARKRKELGLRRRR